MTVNANTPCRFTRGLDHGCKTFELTNIARSMRSRTLVIHHSSGICFNYVLSDKNDMPLILSDTNRGNGDSTCHQPVIYDVTVNNCYI